MMCYRDMTFCAFHAGCLSGDTCPRALTEDIIRQANEWIENVPVCVYMDKPECFVDKGDFDARR
jgi:hypothetical protein